MLAGVAGQPECHVELERAVPQRLRCNFPAAIPDGQLCSGGHTEGGRYNSLDKPGAWQTTKIGGKFTVKLYDQASHGADYFKVYVS
ncbi:lytic polysaccharide monooxygenase [Streptomyces indonesiensis]